MVRNLAGQLSPAQRPFGGTAPRTKRFLVVLQYFNGDRDDAQELATLIADLERIRNREADFLIMRRADAREFDATVVAKLEAKFNKVWQHTCRRRDARGYPWGCNAMFSDLCMLLGHSREHLAEYYAFVNLETDCVPLHPGWIGELASAFMQAEAAGKSAIGHIQTDPVEHLNGMAVYSTDFIERVGGKVLRGGSPQIAYDIFHANAILPLAESTPLIRLDFKRPTISSDELFYPENGIEPAIYHGVKDSSARDAVRARHILFTDQKEVARRVVFTYSNPGLNKRNPDAAKLAIWRDGWRSRGWNPVVLGLRDATRNQNYKRMKDALDRLPVYGDRELASNRFLRWLALESMGGGVFVENDILPGQYTPGDVTDRAVGIVLTKPDSNGINAAIFDRPNLQRFIEEIIGYDAKPEDLTSGVPDVTDMSVWRSMKDSKIVPTVYEYGDNGYERAKLVRFSPNTVMRATGGERTENVMERYLRGN